MSLSSAKAKLDAQGGDPVTGYISKTDHQESYDELVDDTALTGATTAEALDVTGALTAGTIASDATVAGTGLAGGLLSSANPVINGVAAPGTSAIPSRQDHVHASDTTKVTGPASATDNALARFDATGGKLIQNSGVIVDDSDNVTTTGDFLTYGGVMPSGHLAATRANYYVRTPASIVHSLGIGLDTMYACPIMLRAGSTYSRVAIQTTIAATAGGVLRFGLYEAATTGLPGALVADWGTVDSTVTAGLLEKTISLTPTTSGLYWIAVAGQVAGCTARFVRTTEAFTLDHLDASLSTGATTYTYSGVTMGAVSGALPDPFGSSLSSYYAPLLALRFN